MESIAYGPIVYTNTSPISLLGIDTFMIVCAHAICSRAADSAADVRADPPRRYRPCAQLHNLCARARLRVVATSCVCARCAMVLNRVCVRAFVCMHVCVRACVHACVTACPRVALTWHGADRRYL